MADLSGAGVALIGVGGALVGIIGKGALDWLLAVGEVRADREARAEERRDSRIERRDDLQRQTLLDLQIAARDLYRAAIKWHAHDRKALNSGANDWREGSWPDDLEQEFSRAAGSISMLGSRVRDNELRQAADGFGRVSSQMVLANTLVDAVKAKSEVAARFAHLQHRAGQILREMDEVP